MQGIRARLINPGELDPEKQQWAVTHLKPSNNNLIGVIPSQLGDLTELKHLVIDNNNLEGELSYEIGNLIHLRELDLASN